MHAGDLKVLVDAGITMPGATFSLADGTFAAFAPLYDQGEAVRVRSSDLARFTPPEVAATGVSDVTGAYGTTGASLYFIGASGSRVGLRRSSIGETGALGDPTFVDTSRISSSLVPYWPQAAGLRDGRVLLSYVEAQKRAFLAVSTDGNTFEPRSTPVPAGDRRGILVHVGETYDGTWVFTHQVADENWRFTSLVHLSPDEGATWSAPIVVASEAGDVHDTYPIARTDEGADLYYLHLGAEGVFGVFRRALRADGTLGVEQAVTAPDVGHVEKPQARRLPDGRIALTFAVRRGEGAYGIRLAILEGDAPLGVARRMLRATYSRSAGRALLASVMRSR